MVRLLALGLCATALAATSTTMQERPDCPGKIICPLTGELVCKDRCPLGADTEANKEETPELPACCRGEN